MTRIDIGELTPNEPFKTEDPILELVMDSARLPIGPHTFRLVVVDENGNRSQPVTAQVIILDREAPTAVLDVLPGPEVEFGAPFTLSGERSSGIREGERVVYEWTLVRLG